MKVRYKNHPEVERDASQFNIRSCAEVLTGDDSVHVSGLDVFIDGAGWKSLSQAFADKDVIPNNDNTHFGPPVDDEAKARGYNW